MSYGVDRLDEIGCDGVCQSWVYEGGMNEWYHMNMPVEGPCRQPYLVDMVYQHPMNSDAGMEQEVAYGPFGYT